MNKKLRSQIWLFSKLAGTIFDDYTPEKKAEVLKEYHDELALLPSKDYKAIGDFILIWGPESFFAKDEEKIFTMFAENILTTSDFELRPILFRTKEALGGDYRTEKLKSFILKYFVDHYIDKMTIERFIALDAIGSLSPKFGLPVEYVRRAALEMFKKISDLYNEGDETKALNDMGRMFASRLISQELIEKVAKRMGADFYAKLKSKVLAPTSYAGEDHRPKRLNDLRNKEKLTVFDVAELLYNDGRGNGIFTSAEFQNMLNKSDDKAKNYLRSFLYWSMNKDGVWLRSGAFMLDDEYKPMNIEYKNIPFPANFYAVKDWSATLTPKEQQEWAKIFADFKVPANIKS